MTPRSRPATCIAASLVVGACSSAWHTSVADREVESILSQGHRDVLGDREERLVQPTIATPAAAPAPTDQPPTPTKAAEPDAGQPPADSPRTPPSAAEPESPPSTSPPEQTPAPPATTVDLEQSLAIACRDNRDYRSRRESLYRQGLSYSLARFDYGPQFRAAVSHVWNETEDSIGSQRLAGSFGVSQILPTGGVLSLDSGVGNTWTERAANNRVFGGPLFDNALSLNLTQPLLRGAGYEVTHAALTQAERDLVYAIRDFELFRETFTISVARSFFDLVTQQQTLANQETNQRQATFDRRQAEAMLQVDRKTEIDVYRARRREIDSQNSLLDARAAFERARDQFKILLGMPTATALEIAPAEPPFEAVRYDTQSAIAAAKHNRLDLRTEQERLDDRERSVRIAENALLPRVDLALGVSFGADPDSSFEQALPDRWAATAGLTMDVPLQQIAQRAGYRSAQLSLDQARRDHEQLLDQVELEIGNQLRNLHRLEQQIELQSDQITQEQRAVRVTEIRYQSGTVENRDLLEARQALFNAQNALIQLRSQHFIARLELLRDLGLMFVDDRGMWR